MGKMEERGRTMDCAVYPLNGLKKYKYVVILSRYQGKLLLSRHRERNTWETQGGHIEPGETPAEAARRELFEESGALAFSLTPLCDYHAADEVSHANGMVFAAEVKELGPLPESEMAETALFDQLPENLTYPDITPLLYRRWMEVETGER
jgi:8-oxo-dGTP diphosphatase